MSFLTAKWRMLAFANYPVDPALLTPYVPPATELDTWEGAPYVSLIGFLFDDVRLLGVRVPFHTSFEEVNLRFYVRRKVAGQWRRGVVFIREIVPKPAISFVANTLYDEAYSTSPMWHRWSERETERSVSYHWRTGGQWQSFGITAEREPSEIEAGGATEFFTEHYWGYAKARRGRTTEYEVTHPRWQQYGVKNWQIDVDFGANYGNAFAFLNQRTPASVFLANGSPITIEGKRTIT